MMMNNVISCSCCGAQFLSKHYNGGSIDHDNTISNIKPIAHRHDSGNETIIDSVLRDLYSSSDCITHGVAMEKLNCLIIGFRRMNRDDIVEFIEEQKPLIYIRFNEAIDYKISGLQDDINYLESTKLNPNDSKNLHPDLFKTNTGN